MQQWYGSPSVLSAWAGKKVIPSTDQDRSTPCHHHTHHAMNQRVDKLLGMKHFSQQGYLGARDGGYD